MRVSLRHTGSFNWKLQRVQAQSTRPGGLKDHFIHWRWYLPQLKPPFSSEHSDCKYIQTESNVFSNGNLQFLYCISICSFHFLLKRCMHNKTCLYSEWCFSAMNMFFLEVCHFYSFIWFFLRIAIPILLLKLLEGGWWGKTQNLWLYAFG